MTDEQAITAEVEPVLWKDRVPGSTQITIKERDASVLKYVRDFAKKIGWKDKVLCKEVISCLRLMAKRYDQVQTVIDVWDRFKPAVRQSVGSVDRAVMAVGADPEEFAALILAAVKNHVGNRVSGMIISSYDQIIGASIESVVAGGSAAERLKLLSFLKNELAPAKQKELPIQSSKDKAEPESVMATKSLDSALAELDAIE